VRSNGAACGGICARTIVPVVRAKRATWGLTPAAWRSAPPSRDTKCPDMDHLPENEMSRARAGSQMRIMAIITTD
jgi:hypothetical protein